LSQFERGFLSVFPEAERMASGRLSSGVLLFLLLHRQYAKTDPTREEETDKHVPEVL